MNKYLAPLLSASLLIGCAGGDNQKKTAWANKNGQSTQWTVPQPFTFNEFAGILSPQLAQNDLPPRQLLDELAPQLKAYRALVAITALVEQRGKDESLMHSYNDRGKSPIIRKCEAENLKAVQNIAVAEAKLNGVLLRADISSCGDKEKGLAGMSPPCVAKALATAECPATLATIYQELHAAVITILACVDYKMGDSQVTHEPPHKNKIKLSARKVVSGEPVDDSAVPGRVDADGTITVFGSPTFINWHKALVASTLPGTVSLKGLIPGKDIEVTEGHLEPGNLVYVYADVEEDVMPSVQKVTTQPIIVNPAVIKGWWPKTCEEGIKIPEVNLEMGLNEITKNLIAFDVSELKRNHSENAEQLIDDFLKDALTHLSLEDRETFKKDRVIARDKKLFWLENWSTLPAKAQRQLAERFHELLSKFLALAHTKKFLSSHPGNGEQIIASCLKDSMSKLPNDERQKVDADTKLIQTTTGWDIQWPHPESISMFSMITRYSTCLDSNDSNQVK